MEDDKEMDFVKTGMNILLQAGEARTAATESMKYMLNGDSQKADEYIKQAKEYIKDAHRAQTDIIQKEAQLEMEGKKQPSIPLLFIHAQDTIMTIITEVNLIEQMEKMYQRLEEKIDGNHH